VHVSALGKGTLDGKERVWNKEKELKPAIQPADKAKTTKGKRLELNETLATIAHLYSHSPKNKNGVKSQKLNKKDFWNIFGQVIFMRQQIEVCAKELSSLFYLVPVRQLLSVRLLLRTFTRIYMHTKCFRASKLPIQTR